MSRNFSSNKNFDIFKTQKKNKTQTKRSRKKNENENEDLFNEIFNTYETQTRKVREKSYQDRNPLIF